jgi:hypothetical protein
MRSAQEGASFFHRAPCLTGFVELAAMSIPLLPRRAERVLGKIARTVVKKIVALPIRRQLRFFDKITADPKSHQEALLQRIIAYHRDTDFGDDHGFGLIGDTADFRRQLPVAGYDYFEPYIARVRKGDIRALLGDEQVLMFALTSGTTAARKSIPVTRQYLEDYRRGWNLWGLRLLLDHPEVAFRPILQMSGDCDEFRTEAGIPCGAVTGLTAKMQRRLVRLVYCVPAAVGKIKETASKYYLVLRLSMPKPVGMVLAANPSTLINLARMGDQEKVSLIRDIHDGTLNAKHQIPDEVRGELGRRLHKRDRRRARELEAIVNRTGTLYPKDYWPSECILGNWTGGSMGAYLRHYPKYYGETPVRDVGLIASEGRMTIPMKDGTPGGVLDIASHYFEFIPESEANSERPAVLGAHELEEGEKYFILLTTAFGLYRYNIHDLVRVTGFYNRTPIVEFLNKGALFANITGEKLSEYHVTRSMTDALRDLDMSLTGYSLVPCWDDEQPYYGLFVERGDFRDRNQALHLASELDRRLGDINMEYASKRGSQRLGPVRVDLIRTGAWQEWDRQRLLQTGGNVDQYKHPCLITDPHFRENMRVENELSMTSDPMMQI